jgi:aryl-alcohol dehydrogenase-like predicted oxidoreductase
MKQRQLGQSGLTVSAIGLGCMGMSEFYGTPDEREAIRTIHRALELGVTLLDTADAYGVGANERLVGKALRDRREQAIVATKFGIVRTGDPSIRSYNGRPAYVRSACEASLERLGIDVIDLYQLHRADPETPIEETVGAMAELVREGKVRYLGLSELQPEDLRRAATTTPIASLQSEYSLFERYLEDGVLDLCEQLGIGLLAYAPLGRGMLTGALRRPSDLDDGDSRHHWPRFQDGNIERNVGLVERLEAFAADKGCSAGQLALAWLLARRPWIVPIPGTKRVRYLEENTAAAEVELTGSDLALLDEAIPRSAVAGGRYPPDRMPSWMSPPLRDG